MSRILRRANTKDITRAIDRIKGVPPILMRFTPSRELETTIPDSGRIPCLPTEDDEPALQDGAGNLLPLAGYSVGY